METVYQYDKQLAIIHYWFFSLSKYLSNKTGKNVKIVEKVKDVKNLYRKFFILQKF